MSDVESLMAEFGADSVIQYDYGDGTTAIGLDLMTDGRRLRVVYGIRSDGKVGYFRSADDAACALREFYRTVQREVI